MTEAPPTIIYASMVSVTLKTALMIAALNGLKVKATDIMSASILAPCIYEIWTTMGQEFGNNLDKNVLIFWAFYCLKSAEATLWNHLAESMKHMEYTFCQVSRSIH